MYVSDEIIWLSVLLLALYFTVEWTSFPQRLREGPDNPPGTVSAYVRALVFPFLAAACWYVMAAMSTTLNNCVNALGGFTASACFTSPTWATTTATVTADPIGAVLYYLFLGLFSAFIVFGIASLIYYWATPLTEKKAPVT